MQVLVGWDDEVEAQTIERALNVNETTARIVVDSDEFEKQATEQHWDVVLMACSFPNDERAIELFKRVRELLPNIPFVGVWRESEITNLAEFISSGLHSHLVRDLGGEFVSLLPSHLEAAHFCLTRLNKRLRR